jgi:hypothetical protein
MEKFQEIIRGIDEDTRFRWLGMSHMSVLGAYWKQVESERKAILGRKACKGKRQLEGKEHMCIHGRPNDARVRVFVIHCNG